MHRLGYEGRGLMIRAAYLLARASHYALAGLVNRFDGADGDLILRAAGLDVDGLTRREP